MTFIHVWSPEFRFGRLPAFSRVSLAHGDFSFPAMALDTANSHFFTPPPEVFVARSAIKTVSKSHRHPSAGFFLWYFGTLFSGFGKPNRNRLLTIFYDASFSAFS